MIDKTCCKCKLTKLVDDFAVSKDRKDGHQGWCKDCVAQRQTERLEANKRKYSNLEIKTELTCTDCGSIKSSEDFYVNRSSNTGRQQRCKNCSKILGKRWRGRGPDLSVITTRKTCADCGVEKESTDFYKTAGPRDGLRSICISCSTVYNSDRIKDTRNEDPVRYKAKKLLRSCKTRAKNYDIPFDLDYEYVCGIMNMTCPVFGLVLDYTSSIPSDASPSIDKFIPALGYIKGNVRIISNRANRFKSDSTVEELIKLSTWAVRTHGEQFGNPQLEAA